MESRADRRTSRALHTVTTHANASDRPTYFIGELRLRPLRLPGQIKPHWTDEGARRRRIITEAIAGLESMHVVVAHLSGRSRKTERYRGKCLELLYYELGEAGRSSRGGELEFLWQQQLSRRAPRQHSDREADPRIVGLRARAKRKALDPVVRLGF